MERIVSELRTFAEQYKNCDNLELMLRNKYSTLQPQTPLLLILASGFLQNTPYLEMVEDHPHLSPFKNTIISILEGHESNNIHVNITKSYLS